ncbi:MAG: DHH family phosphoesterase [Lachnospiraceae bacterium]|nr:DHH family phosphoesterase [Lachnospiraceae bacterium]
MKLSDLLVFDDIVIQCHDNPDADAIASGFALYSYYKSHEKKVRFIYSGRNRITKSNLIYLVKTLEIPIEYETQSIGDPDLLLTCDCQYEEGNVTYFAARNVATIDHHQVAKGKKLPKLCEIRSGIGSCCTVIWDMLRKENYQPDSELSSALYYGLFTDTNALSEISHPLDRDMMDEIYFDKSLLRRLNGMNITLEEAKIAGIALLGVEFHSENRYAILEAQPCDPNILGLISDFFLAVDTVDVCLVYSVLDYGIKFSVRSDTPEVRADELASYISKNIGSGGGHMDKAGGFIQHELLVQYYKQYATASERDRIAAVTPILREKMQNYYLNSDIYYAGKTKLSSKGMKEYVKLPLTQGYVVPSEFLPLGQHILVRSMEGDMNLMVEKDTVVMIGIRGEVYPTKLSVFKGSYKKLRGKYDLKLEYTPTIKVITTSETIELAPYAHMCVSTGGNHIMAKRLKKEAKVFTKWHKNEYLKGEPGDYIAYKCSDPDDIYIIGKDFFPESYKPV